MKVVEDGLVRFDDAMLADPVGWYARLREQGPVHRARMPNGKLVWLVTRHADVHDALADPRLSVNKANAGEEYRGYGLPPELDANLLNLDGPRHAQLRHAMAGAFGPRRLQSLRLTVRSATARLADGLVPPGPVDLVTGLAAPLAVTVMSEVLGVDVTAHHDFRVWSDAMLAPDPHRPEHEREGMLALHRLVLALVAVRRAVPGPGLVGSLVRLRHERGMTENELSSAVFLVLFAGYENPVHLLGNALAALLVRPDLMAALRRRPELIQSTVDDLVRLGGPALLAIRRFPVADMEIGGVRIPAGEPVMLSLVSANRDPACFTAPDSLQPGRTPNPHLGFGRGPHYCLGAGLAKLELETVISTLLRRFPDLALAGPPRWRPVFRNRGLAGLAVTLGG